MLLQSVSHSSHSIVVVVRCFDLISTFYSILIFREYGIHFSTMVHSPISDKCLVDTQTTMKYAMLAKNIKNQVKINVVRIITTL